MLPRARGLRLLWLLGVVLLLGAPAAAAADSVVFADFDGDGQRDHAELSRREPSAIHVWLSTTQTIWVVRSATPVLDLAARDLDGDRRAELIATNASAGLQIWSDRHTGFAPFHLKRVARVPHVRLPRHHMDDGSEEAPTTDDGETLAPPIALELIPPARAPALPPARVPPPIVVRHESPRVLAPLAPRPPPASR
jgi:hypothetical protein